ncbi:MAG: CRISPR-associated helicase Cas3' [Thermosphaera sp.]
MVSSCKDFKFKSHPSKLLKDHLESVSRRAVEVLKSQGIKDQLLLRAAELIGKTHDFAKYTRYFQEKIMMKELEKRDDSSPQAVKMQGSEHVDRPRKEFDLILYSHAPLSALFGAWIVKREVGDDFLTWSSFAIIHNHHGSLTYNLTTLHDRLIDLIKGDSSRYMKKQLESIKHCISQIEEEMRQIGVYGVGDFVTELLIDQENYLALMKDAYNRLELEVAYSNGNPFERLYRILLLFSALIYADKSEASGIKLLNERTDMPCDIVDKYRPVTACSNQLRWVREEVFRRANRKLQELIDADNVPRVLTITAPTGAGKTATALSTGLKIREYVQSRYGFKPRLIYCLPYINIIEQTYEVASRILESAGIKVNENFILKHHHLYPTQISDRDEKKYENWDEDEPLESKLLLFDSWESEIIVTTFVQFFETLLGTKNRVLLKFHKLFGSVIILDEVQTLPMEFWLLIRKALETLSRYSWIVIMSATIPSVLAPRNAVELVSNHQELYNELNRVQYTFIDDVMDMKKLADFVKKILDGNNIKSIAAIVNTIQASIDLYNELKTTIPSATPLTGDIDRINAPIIAYLSTNIVPRERLKRIERIRDLLKSERKVILVCTQVIEAGVDLDFDIVIRDIAPLDSIVQAGGRCNRNGLKPSGTVYIVKLVDLKGKPTYVPVYGKLAVEEVTRPILTGGFEEAKLLEKVERYFEKINEVKVLEDSDRSREYLSYISDLNLERLSRFNIIEEASSKAKVSVFIELDDVAARVLKEFKELWNKRKSKEAMEDPFRFRAHLRRSRIRLEEFIVETWTDRVPRDTICSDVEIRYVRQSELSEYYDPETGVKITNGLQASFW